eukprot:gene9662-biopygen21254
MRFPAGSRNSPAASCEYVPGTCRVRAAYVPGSQWAPAGPLRARCEPAASPLRSSPETCGAGQPWENPTSRNGMPRSDGDTPARSQWVPSMVHMGVHKKTVFSLSTRASVRAPVRSRSRFNGDFHQKCFKTTQKCSKSSNKRSPNNQFKRLSLHKRSLLWHRSACSPPTVILQFLQRVTVCLSVERVREAVSTGFCLQNAPKMLKNAPKMLQYPQRET